MKSGTPIKSHYFILCVEVHISGHLHHALVVELPANVGATGQTDFGTAQNGCEDLFIWLARNRMLLVRSACHASSAIDLFTFCIASWCPVSLN